MRLGGSSEHLREQRESRERERERAERESRTHICVSVVLRKLVSETDLVTVEG